MHVRAEPDSSTFERIIHPPLEAHSQLRQKLTPGEQAVFDLFHRTLPPKWEIYIQPHLNGLRPDFVLLNPNVGIAVYEVKDWNLDAMDYFIRRDRNTGKPLLWARKDGQEFSQQSQNPIIKVNLYRQEIFNLYCPRLKAKVGFAAITAGVIFPCADGGRVRDLLKPFQQSEMNERYGQYQPVCGREDIAAGNVSRILPASGHNRSKLMNEVMAQDLRGWLVEPDFSATQRRPLELDRNQRQLAETRTGNGYRRIKGPAGSGKSLVLAARAARLMNEGKSVLIATFNITLWHYLRDLIVRALDGPGRIDNAEFTHFHRWCKNLCIQVGWEDKYNALLPKPIANTGIENRSDALRQKELRDEFFQISLPTLASAASEQPEAEIYDAILVDEGQDYRLPWWNALRKALKPGGEMLLVADATQDVYGTAKAWTEETMAGAGFTGGRWAQLQDCYRLPPVAQNVARDFAQRFLPPETLDLPIPKQDSLDLYSHLRWIQCVPEQAQKTCIDAMAAMMQQAGKSDLANSDIVFLSDTTSFGAEVTKDLLGYGIKTVDTFDADQFQRQRQKIGFWMGDARIKATTLHSFKGWEARLLVVYIGNAITPESLALIYAGLTRLKRDEKGCWLTVVCSASELADYGQTWAKYN